VGTKKGTRSEFAIERNLGIILEQTIVMERG